MDKIFATKTPKKVAKEQQKELSSTQRSLEREHQNLTRQEQQLENEIRQAAKQGNTVYARALAKQLLMLRKQKQRTGQVTAQVSSTKIQTGLMATQATLTSALGQTTNVMRHSQMQMQGVMQSAQEYQKTSMQLNMKQELVDDTLDDAFEEELEGEEAQAVYDKVMDEINLDIRGKAPVVPLQQKKVQKEIDRLSMTEDDQVARLLQEYDNSGR